MNSELKALLTANGIKIKVGRLLPESERAYLPLESIIWGWDKSELGQEEILSSINLAIAYEVAQKVSARSQRSVLLDLVPDNGYSAVVFSTETRFCGRGDASSIINALRSAKKLFKDSIWLLAKKVVQEAMEEIDIAAQSS